MPAIARRLDAALRSVALRCAAFLAVALLAAPGTLRAQFPDGESARRPVVVPNVTGARQVAAGNNAFYVLQRDGTVLAWGHNRFGELGNGRPVRQEPDAKGRPRETFEIEPAPVVGITSAVGIAAGGAHALVVLKDGTVWGWGNDRDGQLGQGRKSAGSRVPVQVPGITNAVAVAAEENQSYALLADGRVLGWGERLWYENGSRMSHPTPTPVPGIADAVAVKAGLPTLAIIRDGTVMAWGSGYLGEGSGRQHDYAATRVPQPARVAGIDDAVEIAAGTSRSGVVRRDGTVWVWGGNDGGQLGIGTTGSNGSADARRPVQVPGITNAVALSMGASATAVLRDGTILTWGDGRLGSLGRPGERIPKPARVAGPTAIVAVAAQNFQTLAVSRDGRAWAWGHVLLGR